VWTRSAAAHAVLAAGLLALGLALSLPGARAAGVVLAAFVLVQRLSARPVDVEAQTAAQPQRLLEGDTSEVQVNVRLKARRRRAVELRLRLDPALRVLEGRPEEVVTLRPRAPLERRLRVETPIRGAYDLGALDVRTGDPFGLFESLRRTRTAAPVLVFPQRDELRDLKARAFFPKPTLGMHPVRQPGIGANFYALREYTPNDEMRLVNWKASARMGELIVSEHERETIAEATILVDARAAVDVGTIGHNPLLHGCRAAASVAAALLGGKNAVRLVVYGLQPSLHLHPGTGEGQLHRVLEALATASPAGNDPLSDVVDHFLPHLKPRSPVVLITPLLGDPTVDAAAARLLAQGSHVTVIVPSAGSSLAEREGKTERVTLLHRWTNSRVQGLRALGAHAVVWEPADRLALALERAEAGA
jgi:uncharacterized protein (DUF58 family)